MSEILKNTAGQRVGFSVVDAATGAAKTSGVSVTLTLDGGTQGASAGTLTHEGNGHWDLTLTQAETDADHIYLGWHGTDVVPGGVNLYTTTKRVRDLNDYAGGDTAGTTTLLARLTSTRTDNLDNLDATVTSRLASAGYTTPPTANEAADALLARNIAGGSSTGRTVSEAFAFLRNKWEVVGTTLTVYTTDDATTAWTGVITATTEGHISGMDPA